MRYPTGFYDVMPAPAYYASHHIGSSLMKKLLPKYTAKDFWYPSWMNPNRPDDDEVKEALHIGRAMHHFMLEPHTFHSHWNIKQGVNKSGMANTIGEGQFEEMKTMKAEWATMPRLAQLVQGGRFEVSMFWEHPETGAPCRGRLDYLKDVTVVDLKFVAEVDERAIPRMIAEYHYDIQAAAYLDGLKITTGRDDGRFVLAFQEKKPPYKIVARVLGEDILAMGRSKYEQCCRRYKEFLDAYGPDKPWPAFEDKVGILTGSDMPSWWSFE